MLIFHTGDNHYATKTLGYVDPAMHHAITEAIAAKVEAFIMAGDTFDTTITAHDPAYLACLSAVARMAEHAPVFMIYGTASHDRAGVLEVFTHFKGKHPIYVADRPQQVALIGGKWRFVSDSKDLDGASLMVSAFPGMNGAEIKANDDDALKSDYSTGIFDSWLPFTRLARARGIPTVLTIHGTIQGSVSESRHAMVSRDWEFGTGQLFEAEHSAVMAAHIHAAQDWERQGRRIAYSASISRLVYGHTGDWGALIWDVGVDASNFKRIVTPSRHFLELAYEGSPDMADIAAKMAEMPGAFVRVRYQLDEEHRASVDASSLREMLLAAGAAEVKVEGRINPVVRSRAAGISETTSLPEKLEKFCELTNTPAGPLLARLAMLEAGQQPGARI